MSGWFGKPEVQLEIGQSSLRVVQNGTRLEIPLERSASGLLTTGCRERVTRALRDLKTGPGARVLCALGARGVSLRKLTLPPGAGANLDEVVALQVESEFPLAPEQLAWGYCRVAKAGARDGTQGRQIVVVAAKREVVEDYAGLLVGLGMVPAFTPSAWVASEVCRNRAGVCGLLDVGRFHSELILYEEGIPTALRSVPWGGENITRELAVRLGLGHEEAERLKLRPGLRHEEVAEATGAAVESLAAELKGIPRGANLFLTGGGVQGPGMLELLGPALGVTCELLPLKEGQSSAALARLERGWAKNGDDPRLLIEVRAAAPRLEERATWGRWAVLACCLGLAVLSLRYWEVMVRKPALARRVAEVKRGWVAAPELDRQLSFFQYLETNRPPYLETLEIVAQAAGRGAKFDSMTLDRTGELSLKGTLPSSDQVVRLRDKLIESGWFTNVVFEEQTPMGNDPKVNVRMSARAKKPKPGPRAGRPEKQKG